MQYLYLIPLKKPNLRRCFNFPAHATYAKYASFPENFAPCISGFLSGIIFQDFLQYNHTLKLNFRHFCLKAFNPHAKELGTLCMKGYRENIFWISHRLT